MDKLQVLLVEDNQAYREVLTTLGEDKAKFTKCVNLTEASNIIETDNFDLVILDLPDGDSKAFCQQLASHKNMSHAVVVFLKAKTDFELSLHDHATSNSNYMINNVLKKELGRNLDTAKIYQRRRRLLSLRFLSFIPKARCLSFCLSEPRFLSMPLLRSGS